MVIDDNQIKLKPKEATQLCVASLGSGSKGNATLIRSNNTLLLIDNGFSCKELESRMLQRNINPAEVTAILVTHEHGDHFKGVPAYSNKYGIPVWMNHGTSIHDLAAKIKKLNIFNSHQQFLIGDILVCPVAVPHDSREAIQFVLKLAEKKIGVLTDLGHITPYIINQFQACQVLLLEFNHDRDMLLNSSYPQSLKSRVLGDFGHLSNQQASDFLNDEIMTELKYLVAMHLSEENNQPELVLKSIAEKKLKSELKVEIAHQSVGFEWLFA